MTLLNDILQLCLQYAVVDEYDIGNLHVKEYANGYVVIEGTAEVDFTVTSFSSSTGFHVRTGSVSLPITFDATKNHVAFAADASSGLFFIKALLNGNVLGLTSGQAVQGTVALPDWKTSIYVAGYKA